MQSYILERGVPDERLINVTFYTETYCLMALDQPLQRRLSLKDI